MASNEAMREAQRILDAEIAAGRIIDLRNGKCRDATPEELLSRAMTKEQRDAMRRNDPRIDELLSMRYHEIDNGPGIGEPNYEEHCDYLDELQDELSAIVGEENYDCFWEDYGNER